MKRCSERVEMDVPRRPANALNVEVGTPLPRCRLKTPASWRGFDPRATRWLLSGGDPLVLGPCQQCKGSTDKLDRNVDR